MAPWFLINAVICLIAITYVFGIKFTFLLLVFYFTVKKLWRSNLTWVAAFFVGSSSNQTQEDYECVLDEVDKVKQKIRESFLHSWTTPLQLPGAVQATADGTLSDGLDVLLSYFTSKEIAIPDVLEDIIEGFHLHLIQYGDVKLNARKAASETVLKEFMSKAFRDWKTSHDCSQHEFLKALVTQILLKVLKEEKPTLSVEALAEIICENVLECLISYLSQQENLLKIVINILSDESETLLKTAEIKVNSSKDNTSEFLHAVKENSGLKSEDLKTKESHNESAKPAERNQEDVIDRTFTSFDDNDDEGNENTTMSDSFEHIQTEEYVSNELQRFFKLAPSITPTQPVTAENSCVPLTRIQRTASFQNSTGNAFPTSFENPSDDESVLCSKAVENQEQNIESYIQTVPDDVMLRVLAASIPSCSYVENRQSKVPYVLYEIHYTVTDEKTASGRDGVVYRRWREFKNLAARLEKSGKQLKKYNVPKWWQQISINTDTKKRQMQLETFLKQLIADPTYNSCRDLEEFLGYNGGGEIEFVLEQIKEKTDIEKVFHLMNGFLAKVRGKLNSPPWKSGSPERYFKDMDNSEAKKTKFDLSTRNFEPVNFSENLEESELLGPSFDNSTNQKIQVTRIAASKNGSCHFVAESIFQILLFLLQRNNSLMKNQKLINLLQAVFVPYVSSWLSSKISLYTSPSKLKRFVVLFHDTLWPAQPPDIPTYNIDILCSIAEKVIIEQFPFLVPLLFKSQIRIILDYILEVTTEPDINRELGFCLLNQVLSHSFKILIL